MISRSCVIQVSSGFVIEILNPFLIRGLILWLLSENPVWWQGVSLSVGIGLVSHLKAYLYRYAIYKQTILEHELNSIVRQTVFDKVITLPTTSLDLIDFGLISSFLTSDLISVNSFSYYSIVGKSSIVVLIPTLFILWLLYGWYFVFAPLWIACLMILNVTLSEIAKIFMVRKAKMADSLGVVISEMIKGIKNIKFNVWEEVSLQKIMGLRKGEAKMKSWFYLFTTSSQQFGVLVPSFIIASMYLVRTRDLYEISVAEVYFLISICSLLVMPTIFIVQYLTELVRSRVTFERLNNFMSIESDHTLEKLSNQHLSLKTGEIKLQNYTACWVDPGQEDQLKSIDPAKAKKEKSSS